MTTLNPRGGTHGGELRLHGIQAPYGDSGDAEPPGTLRTSSFTESADPAQTQVAIDEIMVCQYYWWQQS
ncbi:hypothetical protein, partial [Paraburkholderia mimosarum]|uniref:hypothetical protein n=1 Tax=Paraburkholderia mimosarum TaxID=312026 RepID=UPI001C3F34B6